MEMKRPDLCGNLHMCYCSWSQRQRPTIIRLLMQGSGKQRTQVVMEFIVYGRRVLFQRKYRAETPYSHLPINCVNSEKMHRNKTLQTRLLCSLKCTFPLPPALFLFMRCKTKLKKHDSAKTFKHPRLQTKKPNTFNPRINLI
ncbi:Hypothetical predicted protein [Scomber scombrus]|uniref:Uncharacterized protein n=1 Tax=Scomber scombrus TaxID=13677 RepID=A0AAV1NZX6_SCOSC